MFFIKSPGLLLMTKKRPKTAHTQKKYIYAEKSLCFPQGQQKRSKGEALRKSQKKSRITNNTVYYTL